MPRNQNPHNLTQEQIDEGYSTVPGPYNPVTGTAYPTGGGGGGSGGDSGLSAEDIAAGYSPIPGPYDPKTGKLKEGGGSDIPAYKLNPKSRRYDPTLAGVDTTQPSPTTAGQEATAGLPGSPLAQGVTRNPDGTISYTGQAGTSVFNPQTGENKFQKALTQLQAQGQTPQDAGVGKMQAGAAIQPTTVEPVSPLGSLMEVDTNFDSIFTNLDKYMEPLQQKKSLLQEYQSMSKALGIQDINEELIDAKRIIEGTEDDIRAEVTAAGGFATDSQVLALANARNKSLIKNYNVLLESRDNAMQQLDTMMNLTIEDRRAAEAEFDRKMGFAEKLMSYKEKFMDNARSQLNTVIDNVGYAGLMSALGNSPYEVALAEKTLGLGAGGLQKLATLPPSEEKSLDLQLKKASLANIYSQITERGRTDEMAIPTITGKPQTAPQASAQGYAERVNEADVIISKVGDKFTGKFAIGGSIPNIFQSGDRQMYEQAKRNFINAVLRRESGAAIANSEFESAAKQYFPQRGDTPETVAQKAMSRNTTINNLYRESNVNRPVLPGQIIESDGIKYRVGNDGELEKI